MQDFRELMFWQRSHQLVLQLYKITKELPPSENFGLLLNLRRSAIAMATRIADGAGRPSDAEFAIELKRARATGYELEYLLLVSKDLGYLEESVYDGLVAELIEIRKMISGFLNRLKAVP